MSTSSLLIAKKSQMNTLKLYGYLHGALMVKNYQRPLYYLFHGVISLTTRSMYKQLNNTGTFSTKLERKYNRCFFVIEGATLSRFVYSTMHTKDVFYQIVCIAFACLSLARTLYFFYKAL